MARAIDIARYLLRLANDELEPELMTHMRLQKLLYYAQGLALAYRKERLFLDRIEAWEHGPVVASVYPRFADYKGEPIAPHEATPVELSSDDAEFVASVWMGFRQHSAIALRNMTHSEPPWLKARQGVAPGAKSSNEITAELLSSYFTQVCGADAKKYSGVAIEDLRKSEQDAKEGRIESWESVRKRLVSTVQD